MLRRPSDDFETYPLTALLVINSEYLRAFPGLFERFPRMFGNIPRNVWLLSPEYSIPPIPCVHRISFPIPVFLVLYIAEYVGKKSANVFILI